MKKFNKLVRDRTPEILDAKGLRYKVRTANCEEYLQRLGDKLSEELEEYFKEEELDAGLALKHDLEELADIVEVVYAILDYHNIPLEEFEKVRLNKKEARGGFKEQIILIQAETD